MLALDQVIIEPAMLDDIADIQALERHCFRQAWRREQYEQDVLDRRRGLVLVARADGRLVGWGSLQIVLDQAHLETIGVHQGWRRQGLGSRLLDSLLEHARARQVREVFLEVRAANVDAQRLYARRGFHTVGRRRAYYEDPPDDGLVMALVLDPGPPAT